MTRRSLVELATVFALGRTEMRSGTKVQVVHRDSFCVVGLQGRTGNSREASGQGIIGPLWQKLMSERLLDHIPDKADSNIVAVYSDYESDEHGDFTYTLGARVLGSGPKDLPAGFHSVVVPAGRYALFSSARGPVPGIVIETWKQIWNIKTLHPELRRSYGIDYELYDERARNPTDSQVDVFVGVQ